MVGLSGLEKFSHLEDKIYRTIELTKTLRQEKESLEKELSLMRRNLGSVPAEQERLEKQVEKLAGRTRHHSHEGRGDARRGGRAGSRNGGGTQMTTGIADAQIKEVWKHTTSRSHDSESRSTIRLTIFALTATLNTSLNSPILLIAGCARFPPAL